MSKPDPSGSTAYFDLVRSGAGVELESSHYDDFMRLVKTIRYGSPTQLLLVEFDDVAYRKEVMGLIVAVARNVGLRPDQYVVSASVGGVRVLEDGLATLAEKRELIHLVGDQTWFDDLDDPRWEDLNYAGRPSSSASRSSCCSG